jgi:hypothetical protein
MSKFLKPALGLAVLLVGVIACVYTPQASASPCPPYYCYRGGACLAEGTEIQIGQVTYFCNCNSDNGTNCSFVPL